MSRNPTKVSADLRKAAARVQKIAWKKPVVLQRVRSARDAPAPKGVSVAQMVRDTPEAVRAAAKTGDVHIIRQQRKVERGQLVRWFMTSTAETFKRGPTQARQHVQTIKVKDKAASLHASKDLYYACDCGYWKFYCDWAAWKKGASELKYSTDEPPDEKNPRHLVYPCKHLLIVCEAVLEERL